MKRMLIRTLPRRHQARGVATLVVVMVLFFVVTMVAAYTNRNMIFEQRTGANFYRSAQAQEVAEAGLQWAVGLLNSGRIDAACQPSTASTDNTFRQRYLNITAATGVISAINLPSTTTPLVSSCVINAESGDWTCSCPSTTAPTLTAPTTSLAAPAFRVSFQGAGSGGRPGVVAVRVVGCTRLENACLTPQGNGLPGEGRAVVEAMLFQSGFGAAPPVAALTVRGTVSAGGGFTISNSNVGDSGTTVQASGTVDATALNLNSQAGNALGGAGSVLLPNAALAPPDLAGSVPMTSNDRFFALLFGTTPATYFSQPAVLDLGNCGGGCDGAAVDTAAENNAGRPIRVAGDLSISTSVEIGTASEPVILIIDGGSLDISAAGTVIHGLVVVRRPSASPDWTVATAGRINGALVVDGNVVGSGNLQVDYSGDVIRRLRAANGGFVLAPGAWRDNPLF
jgi:Tfp pilus assembly protein PilX